MSSGLHHALTWPTVWMEIPKTDKQLCRHARCTLLCSDNCLALLAEKNASHQTLFQLLSLQMIPSALTPSNLLWLGSTLVADILFFTHNTIISFRLLCYPHVGKTAPYLQKIFLLCVEHVNSNQISSFLSICVNLLLVCFFFPPSLPFVASFSSCSATAVLSNVSMCCM